MEIPHAENSVNLHQEHLQKRLEQAPFHSEKDHSIASSILADLTERFSDKKISETKYRDALAALDTLTPRRNEKGFRAVADIVINPIMERTISSRLKSKEHDLTSPEESWGSLPEIVRKKIAATNIALEMTGTCTVKCSFCDLAEKGPIEDKISFDSLRSILEFSRDNLKKEPGITYSDNLYWGSDPFDAKWSSNGIERDYVDVANMYWDTMKGQPRCLYTSTALPLGEEFRVLNFANHFLKTYQTKSISEFNKLRISLTNANSQRVEAIREVLSALHDDPFKDEVVYISDNRNLNEARTGSRWNTPGNFSSWDIIGPNCRDGVIIGIKSVDAVVMEGSSKERPKGESRFPLSEIDQDTQTATYTIPKYYQKPDDLSESPFLNYPHNTFTEIKMDLQNNQILHETTQTVNNNPHRSFLRVVATHNGLMGKYDGRVPSTVMAELKSLMGPDIQVIDDYLNLGADNWAMESFMKYFNSL